MPVRVRSLHDRTARHVGVQPTPVRNDAGELSIEPASPPAAPAAPSETTETTSDSGDDGLGTQLESEGSTDSDQMDTSIAPYSIIGMDQRPARASGLNQRVTETNAVAEEKSTSRPRQPTSIR